MARIFGWGPKDFDGMTPAELQVWSEQALAIYKAQRGKS